jgi:hypothetical protein
MKCPKDGSECPIIQLSWSYKYFEYLKSIGLYGRGTGEI